MPDGTCSVLIPPSAIMCTLCNTFVVFSGGVCAPLVTHRGFKPTQAPAVGPRPRPKYRHMSFVSDGWEDDVVPTPVKCEGNRQVKRELADGALSSTKRSRLCAVKPEVPTKCQSATSTACASEPDGFAAHFQSHRCKTCDKCTYAVNRAAWEAAAFFPGRGTWLKPQPVEAEDWWLGCGLCEEATTKAAPGAAAALYARPLRMRGQSLHLGNIRQHCRSKAHCRVCEAAPLDDAVAPPLGDFEGALLNVGLGHQKPSANSARKSTSLEWCLAEAIRDADRAFLRRAETIAVMLDERHGRLLVKYHGCDERLTVRFGVLGLLRNAGKTAPQIAAAVHQAVRAVCMRRKLHPGCNVLRNGGDSAGTVDEVLARHILEHIVFYVSDGDSASQLSGHMLHRDSERAALAEKLPNLRVVIRDRAHSSRHLNEHSFAADPILHLLLQTAVLKPHSIVRQIKDSQPLRGVFVGEARNQAQREDLLAVVTDMSFAPQRFDSLQKPLGRIVLNLEALLSYCTLVVRERGPTSDEGQGCIAFLECLTEENVILLGMMADASDECMILTRFMDKEAFEVGSMRIELVRFQNRIDFLFLHKQCLKCGYTQVALEFLKQPRVLQVPGRVLRTLGSKAGAAETDVLRALARMVNWVKVTQQIAETEFPQHDLLSAFNVFFISSVGGSEARRLNAADREALNKIARGFNVDAVKLAAQTEEHLNIVEHEMRLDSSLTSFVAWSKALARTQKTSKSRHKYAVDVLLPVLQLYAVASGSTSGIERNFSSAKRNLGESWQGSPVAEERRMVLSLAHAALTDRAAVLAAARQVWAESFGPPRVTACDRRGKWSAGRREQPKSHAAWLRRRRADSTPSAGPAAGPDSLDAALSSMADALWSDRQTREVARQQQVRKDRKLQAAVEGLEVDATPEFLAQVAGERAAGARRQRALETQHRRTATIRSLPAPSDIQGKTVWVDPAVEPTMKESGSAWWAPQALRVVDRRELAHVLVVRDAAQPGGRNQAVAHLRGCLVTTPEYFLSPPGAALQWKAALLVPRVVYLSQAVCAAHMVMVDLIRSTESTLQLPNGKSASRWRVFVGEQWEDFKTLSSRRRTHEIRTILHATDRGDPTFQDAANVMALHEFLASLGHLDGNASILGMCKR